jgi:hypothetical protein
MRRRLRLIGAAVAVLALPLPVFADATLPSGSRSDVATLLRVVEAYCKGPGPNRERCPELLPELRRRSSSVSLRVDSDGDTDATLAPPEHADPSQCWLRGGVHLNGQGRALRVAYLWTWQACPADDDQ